MDQKAIMSILFAAVVGLIGWHVNLRLIRDIAAAEEGEEPTFRDTVEALNATYGTAPVTPVRVWL